MLIWERGDLFETCFNDFYSQCLLHYLKYLSDHASCATSTVMGAIVSRFRGICVRDCLSNCLEKYQLTS